MQSSPKFLTTLDKYLLGGLGCGVTVLCLLGGWFYYIFKNVPVPNNTVTQTAVSELPTLTPIPSNLNVPLVSTFPNVLSTPNRSPTPTITPSPLPGVFAETKPVGKIAFACYIKQIDQICLMNADGTSRQQLTNFPATAFYPSISPDGSTIFFSAKQPSEFDLYSMSINGKHIQQLSKNIGNLYAPELSPNGEKVVFANESHGLWLMNPDGKHPHAISNRDDIDPTWSPDGSMIAFASSRAGARQLFVMNADGSNIRQVTALDNMGGRSTWSPDGKRLAFYRGPQGDHNIFVINVDGSGLVQLTNGGDNLGPSWSPDGNWIAFTSYHDSNNEIYIIHPDGTGTTRLTNNSISDWQPRWGK